MVDEETKAQQGDDDDDDDDGNGVDANSDECRRVDAVTNIDDDDDGGTTDGENLGVPHQGWCE